MAVFSSGGQPRNDCSPPELSCCDLISSVACATFVAHGGRAFGASFVVVITVVDGCRRSLQFRRRTGG
jgi:hypothetical protein